MTQSQSNARLGRRSSWGRLDTLLLTGLVVLAGLVRLPGLSRPDTVIFDETYYAKDACLYLGYGQALCGSKYATEESYVHPPTGKWLIAAGIRVFGYDAFGWRVVAATFGTGLVALVYALAQKLFRSRWVAGTSGLLAATDFLLVVQSRVAMLDIFLAFFVMLGFLFLAVDRERLLAAKENALLPFPGRPPRREPEWRYAAGIALGIAVSVKWSGALALSTALVMATFSSVTLVHAERRLPREERSTRPGLEFASVAIGLAIIPVLVYLLGWSAWFVDNLDRCDRDPDLSCRDGLIGTMVHLGDVHRTILRFHLDLNATHSYQSEPWTWPVVGRPVAYHFTGPPDTERNHHILAFGNPAVWWASAVSAVWLLWRSGRRRPERFVLGAWAGQYLPWIAFAARPGARSALFFFYMTPVVPFMLIGLAAGLSAIRETGTWGRRAVAVYLVLGVGVLTYFFLPLLTGSGLSPRLWGSRMWFGSWV